MKHTAFINTSELLFGWARVIHPSRRIDPSEIKDMLSRRQPWLSPHILRIPRAAFSLRLYYMWEVTQQRRRLLLRGFFSPSPSSSSSSSCPSQHEILSAISVIFTFRMRWPFCCILPASYLVLSLNTSFLLNIVCRALRGAETLIVTLICTRKKRYT